MQAHRDNTIVVLPAKTRIGNEETFYTNTILGPINGDCATLLNILKQMELNQAPSRIILSGNFFSKECDSKQLLNILTKKQAKDVALIPIRGQVEYDILQCIADIERKALADLSLPVFQQQLTNPIQWVVNLFIDDVNNRRIIVKDKGLIYTVDSHLLKLRDFLLQTPYLVKVESGYIGSSLKLPFMVSFYDPSFTDESFIGLTSFPIPEIEKFKGRKTLTERDGTAVLCLHNDTTNPEYNHDRNTLCMHNNSSGVFVLNLGGGLESVGFTGVPSKDSQGWIQHSSLLLKAIQNTQYRWGNNIGPHSLREVIAFFKDLSMKNDNYLSFLTLCINNGLLAKFAINTMQAYMSLASVDLEERRKFVEESFNKFLDTKKKQDKKTVSWAEPAPVDHDHKEPSQKRSRFFHGKAKKIPTTPTDLFQKPGL